jgi:hypothetical protein
MVMKLHRSHLVVALVGLLASAAVAHGQHRGGSGSHGGSSSGRSGSGQASKSGPGRTPPGKMTPGNHPPAAKNNGTKPKPTPGATTPKPIPGANGKNTKPNPANPSVKKPVGPGSNNTTKKPGTGPGKNPAVNKPPKLNQNDLTKVGNLVDRITSRITDAVLLAGLARLAEGVALSPAQARSVVAFLDAPDGSLAADDATFLQSCLEAVGTENDDDGGI